jgi:small conductance mechanosensitive channel
MRENIIHITAKLQGWWDVFIENLPNLGIAIFVLMVSYFLSRLVFKGSYKLISKRVSQDSVSKLIARVISLTIVLGGLLLALVALNLGKSVTGLLTGAGISGIIIGLALQGTLSNTVAGIVLSFRKNISIGNWIETNSFSGEVVDIDLNFLVLRESDNNMVILPNKTVMESPFKNYSLTSKMRVVIECGVAYESNLEEVKSITTSVINKYFDQNEINETPEFYYTEFGSSSINFISRFWIYGKSGVDKLKAKSKIIMELKKAFDQNNITIPFPIRTLHLDDTSIRSSKSIQDLMKSN